MKPTVCLHSNFHSFSAINNEGVTRLLEVVKINKNNKQTAENVNNNQDDALSAPIIPSKGRRNALKNAQILVIFRNIFNFLQFIFLFS